MHCCYFYYVEQFNDVEKDIFGFILYNSYIIENKNETHFSLLNNLLKIYDKIFLIILE
jgi:hypothetical protein